MKKRIIQSLLAIVCCVTVALSAIPTAEAAMRASVVTGKVTLNGQVIDNKTAKYPLLIYSNITYFPMTYHLSRFMLAEDYQSLIAQQDFIISHIYATGQTVIPPNE